MANHAAYDEGYDAYCEGVDDSDNPYDEEKDEYTVVLRGRLHVNLKDGEFDVGAGQAIIVQAGEWVQYSSLSPEGAEYIAVCIPAFSPETVHRE